MTVFQLKRDSLVLLHLLALLGVGLACYHNSFSGPFIFDDIPWIVENKSLRQLWPLRPLVGTNRPILNLTFAANYAVGGTNVVGYHVVNLLIHLTATVVLYDLIRRTLLLLGNWSKHPSRAAWFAAIVSGLWTAHPLQTQSVTYVVQRSESLMSLLYLLCIYCFLRGIDEQRRYRWHVATVICCWMGMGTKEVMVTAPLAVLLFDMIFVNRRWQTPLKTRLALYAGLFLSWSWVFSNASVTLASTSSSVGSNSQGITGSDYFVSQPQVLLSYLRLFFWPDPLCIDYYATTFRTVSEIAAPGIVILGLFVVCLWALRYRPVVGFPSFMTFLLLAPSSSFLPIADPIVEHRMYLPLACLIVLTVASVWWAVNQLERRCKLSPTTVRAISAVAVLGTLTALTSTTIARNRDYHSVVSLWGSAMEVNPQNPRAFNQLGVELEKSGRHDKAFDYHVEAVRLSNATHRKPLAEYHYSLARSLHRQEHIPEAIFHYQRAIQLRPRSTAVLLNLGIAYCDLGNVDEAIAQYREAIRIRPNYSLAHNNIAIAFAGQCKYDEALNHFEKALKGRPSIPSIRHTVARMLIKMGKPQDGAELYLRLAMEELQSGRRRVAVEILDRALQQIANENRADIVEMIEEQRRKLTQHRSSNARPDPESLTRPSLSR